MTSGEGSIEKPGPHILSWNLSWVEEWEEPSVTSAKSSVQEHLVFTEAHGRKENTVIVSQRHLSVYKINCYFKLFLLAGIYLKTCFPSMIFHDCSPWLVGEENHQNWNQTELEDYKLIHFILIQKWIRKYNIGNSFSSSLLSLRILIIVSKLIISDWTEHWWFYLPRPWWNIDVKKNMYLVVETSKKWSK